ncbi:hypothetical protein HTZ84_12000 [Haloterrigena sp. SYSU A558-1]|uniref:DUF1851 domain-containing protein n=1 Tax=Haloterrigena gelatinilytica TaxID=2741724 RepID=A0ABX2LCB6_9EURY|nr:hypothetical protein [Haloterrigena gelatinilytica]NUC73025.1 hypothetical protein [Haloterrigena gelatinilytica]
MSDIEGQIITAVRHLASDVPAGFAWTVAVPDAAIALELGDGSLLIPVSDVEGNKPGVFYTEDVNNWDVITGSRITDLTPMALSAMEYRGWEAVSGYRPPVLTVDTGEQLYPVADPEGNQRGILFRVQDGETFIVDFDPVDGE